MKPLNEKLQEFLLTQTKEQILKDWEEISFEHVENKITASEYIEYLEKLNNNNLKPTI